MPRLSIPCPVDAARLQSLRGDLACAAARVWELWEQDTFGFDEDLGEGGICHLVASSMAEVLADAGVSQIATIPASVGENHVFVVAGLADGVYAIDIPPHVYETGAGYRWRKRPEASFTADVVLVSRIGDPLDDTCFEAHFLE